MELTKIFRFEGKSRRKLSKKVLFDTKMMSLADYGRVAIVAKPKVPNGQISPGRSPSNKRWGH